MWRWPARGASPTAARIGSASRTAASSSCASCGRASSRRWPRARRSSNGAGPRKGCGCWSTRRKRSARCRRTKKTGREMRGFIILLACLLAAGAARAAERTPALQKLVEDAAKQGEIDLVWSQSTLGGTRGAAAFEAGLNKMFGTKLRIKFTPGPSMPTVGNEIAMRQLAGQPAQTDAYIGFSRDLSDMVAKDLFRSVAWTGLMPARITPAVVDANGTMVKTVTGLLGVTYNTALAPAKPEYLRDFLAPGWKGKIATTPYSAGFDVLAAKDLWGPEKALDYARALSGQIAGLIRCDDNERIA